MKLQNLPLFHKYWLSYVTILILPLLGLGYIGYKQIATNLYDQVAKGNNAMLAYMKDHVDAKLVSMNQIAARIGTDARLTPYALEQTPFSAVEAKTLLDYKAPNDFILEMALYIRGGNQLYSPHSSYTTSSFMNAAYRYPNWSESAFTKDINTIKKNVLRPAEPVELGSGMTGRLITYMVPIPFASSNPYGTLIFLFNESELAKAAESDPALRSGSMMILDQSLQPIAVSNRSLQLQNTPELREFFSGAEEQDSERITLNGKPYFVSYMKSKLTAWTYALVLPDGVVLKPVNDMKNEWQLYFVIILFIGSFAVYGLWKVNYRPIEQLVSYVEEKWGRRTRGTNELERVQFVLSEIAETNVYLDDQLQRNKRAIVDHWLSRLLKGEFASKEHWNEITSEIGVMFVHERIGCLMLQFHGDTCPNASRLRVFLENDLLQWGINGFVMDGMSASQFTVIVTMEEHVAHLLEWIEKLRIVMNEENGLQLTAGVSRFYDDWNQAGKSYLEASTALECRLFRGNNKTICFEEKIVHASVGNYPYEEMERLEVLIREGNTTHIKEMVNIIVQHIKHNETTLYMARCISYDMVNTLLKAMQKLTDGKELILGQYQDVRHLMEFDTVEHMAEMVSDFCHDVCQAISAYASTTASEPIGGILAYIEQNYKNYEISVQQIADDFSVSLSYLGRYFKEHTGRTIFEYIDELRIEQAKELLQTKEYTVKEIVQMVGYSDSSSFIRKFKRIVRLTPGEYRKLYSSVSE
ncbi:helix-turn-helix domain-containing protein [Paenibacillus silviterrae]|uniref:helix-turn-helix domain-containing protein n=1 Tax=Paenibacillus silviterrae TaxID=3242194 RepID=UPI002543B1BB|nr:helix-turn-helix domain-containing protein [Paenibacillus chinjuensis]